MTEWIVDDFCPKDELFYIIPSDLKVWTIKCPEMYYDKERETTVLTLKSKNYYFREKK
jgi:hypothetical protein